MSDMDLYLVRKPSPQQTNWHARADTAGMEYNDYVLMLEAQVSMYREQLDAARESCVHSGLYSGAFHAEAMLLTKESQCSST